MKGCTSRTLVIGFIAAFFTLNAWIGTSNPSYVCDYFVYWIVPQYFKSTHDRHVYGPEGEMKTRSFAQTPSTFIDRKFAGATEHELKECVHLQTPMMYALFGLLATGNYDRDRLLFSRLCLLALFASSVLLFLIMGFDLELSLLTWVVIVFLYAPAGWDAAALNTSKLLLLTVVGAAAFLRTEVRHRHVFTGLLLSFAVLLKPTTALVVLFLVVSRIARRQWLALFQEGAGGLAGALLGIASGSLYWGNLGVWMEWASRVFSYVPAHASFFDRNFSAPALLQHLFHVDLASVVLLLGLAAGTARILHFSRKQATASRYRTGLQDFELDLSIIASGLLMYLLISRLVWIHYYVLALPAILLQLRENRPRSHTRMVVLGISLSVFIGLPLDFLSQLFNWTTPMATGILYWGSALSLFLLGTSESFPGNLRASGSVAGASVLPKEQAARAPGPR